jgi:hypothetical protein
LYRDGTGTPADPVKAVECQQKAAESGSSDGIDRLGSYYQYGDGVQQDENAAFQLFQRAAEMGNPKGQLHLGECYLNGIGCHRDNEIALKWFALAASSGHPLVLKLLEDLEYSVEKLVHDYHNDSKRFGTNFDNAFQDGQRNRFPAMPPKNVPQQEVQPVLLLEPIPAHVQAINVWQNNAAYPGLPENVNVWHVNFFVKNEDYHALADVAERENIDIARLLELQFFTQDNVFLDHFGGRFPKQPFSQNSAWIAAIVVGRERDIKSALEKILNYLERSGAAKGYDDLRLQYVPYTHQPYIGYAESFDKETVYRYRWSGDILQRLAVP